MSDAVPDMIDLVVAILLEGIEKVRKIKGADPQLRLQKYLIRMVSSSTFVFFFYRILTAILMYSTNDLVELKKLDKFGQNLQTIYQ